jgi:plastocyanin
VNDSESRNGTRGGMMRIPGGHRFRSARAALGVLAALTLVLVSGCGGGDHKAAGSTQTHATTTPSVVPPTLGITIENFKYSHLDVSAGALVRVDNSDDVEHTVTSDTPGLFDVHVRPHGAEVFTAPTVPGTYPYHSTDQPTMHGELVVHR